MRREAAIGGPMAKPRMAKISIDHSIHQNNMDRFHLIYTIVSANSVTPNPEWRLMDQGEPATVRLQARMITSTNDSAVMAVIKGFGLTRLLSYQVAEHLQAGRLKTVLSDFEQHPCPCMWCIGRGDKHRSERAHFWTWRWTVCARTPL